MQLEKYRNRVRLVNILLILKHVCACMCSRYRTKLQTCSQNWNTAQRPSSQTDKTSLPTKSTTKRRMGQSSSPLSKFRAPKRLVLYLERPLAARNSSSGCPSLSTSMSLAASPSGSGTVRVAALKSNGLLLNLLYTYLPTSGLQTWQHRQVASSLREEVSNSSAWVDSPICQDKLHYPSYFLVAEQELKVESLQCGKESFLGASDRSRQGAQVHFLQR